MAATTAAAKAAIATTITFLVRGIAHLIPSHRNHRSRYAEEALVRELELKDVPRLADIAPEEWHVALDAIMLQHLGRPYFHARVAEADEIAAVGQGIETGRTGWVGNIIVRPEYRRRGLGSRITSEIVDVLRSRGCVTLLLVATALGEPVYRKLGFRTTGEYVFLRVPRLAAPRTCSIRRLAPSDTRWVLDLDATATGERREALLAPHLAMGWVDDGDGGFFLPSFGNGFIAAASEAAGLELLAFRHAQYPGNAVIPASNPAALRYLMEHGAEEILRAPRMACGEEAGWRPEFVFGRAAGYCG